MSNVWENEIRVYSGFNDKEWIAKSRKSVKPAPAAGRKNVDLYMLQCLFSRETYFLTAHSVKQAEEVQVQHWKEELRDALTAEDPPSVGLQAPKIAGGYLDAVEIAEKRLKDARLLIDVHERMVYGDVRVGVVIMDKTPFDVRGALREHYQDTENKVKFCGGASMRRLETTRDLDLDIEGLHDTCEIWNLDCLVLIGVSRKLADILGRRFPKAGLKTTICCCCK